MNALRILYVDDDRALTTVFRIVLEASGRYVVRGETSGEKALEAAREFLPDLILLDKSLGDLQGDRVAAKLHADPQFRLVPIAFTTGGLTRQEAREAEVPTLPKPVTPGELLGFVDDILNFNALCAG
jgi:CheY-like chemotaxis protein